MCRGKSINDEISEQANPEIPDQTLVEEWEDQILRAILRRELTNYESDISDTLDYSPGAYNGDLSSDEESNNSSINENNLGSNNNSSASNREESSECDDIEPSNQPQPELTSFINGNPDGPIDDLEHVVVCHYCYFPILRNRHINEFFGRSWGIVVPVEKNFRENIYVNPAQNPWCVQINCTKCNETLTYTEQNVPDHVRTYRNTRQHPIAILNNHQISIIPAYSLLLHYETRQRDLQEIAQGNYR